MRRSTLHTLHLRIPPKRIFNIWNDTAVDPKGWRVFLWMFQVLIEFRREPLGSYLPRHGVTLMLMIPFGTVTFRYRNPDWYSIGLRTYIEAGWGPGKGWQTNQGALLFHHWYRKEFWTMTMEEVVVGGKR